MTDDNDDAPPAATVDLTNRDAQTALETRDTRRHAALDDLAVIHNAALSLTAALRDHRELAEVVLRDVDTNTDLLRADVAELAYECREYALENEEHAVRWTLDPYDEMDE